MGNGDWRENNFDLIRLAAALQVLLVHALSMLKPDGLVFRRLDSGLSFFPGVPIFFVISGLLVSRSYEHCASLRDYYRNRGLRILPGLWVCLVASVAVICIAGVATLGPVSRGDWLLWWAAQMTLFQQYQPEFLRPLGTGLFNGSLWTIPVELEFYLLLPVLYAVIRRNGPGGTSWLCVVAAISLAAHLAIEHRSMWPQIVAYPLVFVNVIPYLWMFLVGVLIQRHWTVLRRWFAGRAPWWILAYALLCAVSHWLHIGVGGAAINPLFLLPLAGLIMSLAVSAPTLSRRILRHHDISYGTYIYHMPVINLLLQLGLAGTTAVAIVLPVSLTLATASWLLVERPFLARKRSSLHPLQA